MEKEKGIERRPATWKVGLVFICWAAFLGFDLLLHGGLLTEMYTRPNPALLSADLAFYRIPLGYLSFLVLVVLIYWLLSWIAVNDWKKGFRFGVMFGALLGVASTLGLYSILTVDLDMLIGWALGQTIEFGIVGGIIGAANSGISLKRLFVGVAAFVVSAIILTIILQTVGLARPMKLIGS